MPLQPLNLLMKLSFANKFSLRMKANKCICMRICLNLIYEAMMKVKRERNVMDYIESCTYVTLETILLKII